MSSIYSIDPVHRGMTAEGIVALCDEGIAHAASLQTSIKQLAAAEDATLTKEATLLAFDELTYALQLAGAFANLMSLAHPDAAVRDAAKTVEPKLDAFITALYLDQDVFEVFRRYEAKQEQCSDAEKRLLAFTLRDFRRNGLQLDEAKKERLRAINQELTTLGQQFEVNIAEDTRSIEIKPDQLNGLPETYRQARKPNEQGTIKITTDYPDLIPFMKYATDRQAAKKLYILNNTRAKEKNLPILDKLIALRHEKATLLGYATWADFVLEPRMAKTAEHVRAFIDDLHADLKERAKTEYAMLLEVYKKHHGNEDRIPASDAAYVHELAAKEKLSFDSQRLSEYFELNAVKAGVLGVASRIYDIRFVHRPDAGVWHPDVEVYDVNAPTGQTIGRCYLDLFPREGKFKHMAVFGIRETCIQADGTRQLPMCAMVGNFPKPGATPALLSHDDVTTFFHEFGHLLHHLLSESSLATFAGTSVARDFVEVPSQLFEEWAWSRETLDLFARHWKTGEKIPEDLFQAMTAERKFGTAIFTERQLQLADLDLTYHTEPPGRDTTAVMREKQAEYSPFAPIDGTCFQATFGHLVGYDAGYYGYQWSLAIAYDLFSKFAAEGIMNPMTAQTYRQTILSKGGSVDENQLVSSFLGRPSTNDAYKNFLDVPTKHT